MRGAVHMQVTTIGLDIAKNVFQVHGIDAAEKVVVRKQLRRRQVLEFFKALPPCLVGMEACATAHYWARELTKLGQQVRLMPAKDGGHKTGTYRTTHGGLNDRQFNPEPFAKIRFHPCTLNRALKTKTFVRTIKRVNPVCARIPRWRRIIVG